MARFKDLLNSLGFQTYASYLKSELWVGFKRRYREACRPNRCLVCGNDKSQLHHVTYARLGRELFDDVVPLCRSHHEAVHEWLKLAKKSVRSTSEAVTFLRTRVGSVEGKPLPKTKCPKCGKSKKRNFRYCKPCCLRAKLPRSEWRPVKKRKLSQVLCILCKARYPRAGNRFCRACQRSSHR